MEDTDVKVPPGDQGMDGEGEGGGYINGDMGDVEETLEGTGYGEEAWRTPGLGMGSGVASPAGLAGLGGLGSGVGTIGGTKTRIMPTARPPV